MINIKQLFHRYYIAIRPQTNGYLHIHMEGCPFLPEKEKRIYLGSFVSGREALKEAARNYQMTECCRFCLKEHKQETRQLDFAEIEVAANSRERTNIKASYDDALFCFQN